MHNELAIIIPTYNERENIQPMVACLDTALQGLNWEVVFVDDDSPDGTAELARCLAQTDRRIHCVQRLQRKDLYSACIEGILASSAPYVAIMDADMQHDEKILPQMLAALKNQGLDVVNGSRYMQGGSTGDLAPVRVWISRTATSMSRLVLNLPITDPMSGFFMMRRDFFEKVMHKLTGSGFKFLFDILACAGGSVRFSEIPYIMRTRTRGESKLRAVVVWEYLMQLLYKGAGRIVPVRFISFATVGCSGIFVNIFFLWLFHRIFAVDFLFSQAGATLIAMTSNFILNNQLTFHANKLGGRKFFYGLFSYYAACAIGAAINVAVANVLYLMEYFWWLAGLAGAIAGAGWNYAASSTITWRNQDEIKNKN
ncbi:MAG: glycosyltransferase [Gammaproteobacteria bacterium]